MKMVNFSEELLRTVEEKVDSLPEEERENFERRLVNLLYCRGWCRENDIDYVNPDINLAKIIFFREHYSLVS